jgi:hypothetical protein
MKEVFPDCVLVVAEGDMVTILSSPDEHGMENRIRIYPEDVAIITEWMKRKAREIRRAERCQASQS